MIIKELSVKEKAKAYDELLIKAKQIYNKENDVLIIHTIEDLLPEIKESEDERIRKRIIALVNAHGQGMYKDEMIAWLEKQSVHANFRNKIQIGDKVTRNQDGVLVYLSQLKRVAKPAEQKPAWSEEDATHYNRILKELNLQKEMPINASVIEEVKSDIIWLKSLKDRVQPQKQEWSKEDEELYDEIRDAIYYSDCVETAEDIENMKETLFKAANWMEERAKYLQPQPKQEWNEKDGERLLKELKSIRPQNRWKPSDEQITWLYRATDDASKDSRMKQVLNNLLSDLKKLREE